MKSYADFCLHYDLDPASADSRYQYQAYGENLAVLLMAPVGQADSPQTTTAARPD